MKLALLLAGALIGYLLLMWTNPVRASLRDGVRALRRYPRLWATLGLFGCAYAVFELARRLFLFYWLPPELAPPLLWARSVYRPAADWWGGAVDSLWYLPHEALPSLVRSALLPALESTGGLFNNLVPTFPLAGMAALLLLLNWRGHRRTLWRSLASHSGRSGRLLFCLILLTGLFALAKPLLSLPQVYMYLDVSVRWAPPVLSSIGSLFEYLFGMGVQVYLLALAYCWVRGLSFSHQRLMDFAINRFSFVVRWGGIVLLLSVLLVEVPLMLRNFEPFAHWLPADPDPWRVGASVILAVLFLCLASVQINLTFHNESLRRGLRDHFRFFRQHAWPLGWFMVIAALHFFMLHLLRLVCGLALGEGTALWVAWQLLYPWVQGFIGAWLLTAWVSLYRRVHSGRLDDGEWIAF